MATDLFKKQTYLKKNKNGRTEAKSFGQYYWAYLYTLKEKNSALNVKIRKKKKHYTKSGYTFFFAFNAEVCCPGGLFLKKKKKK